jgi:hypothetical protein
MKKINYIIINNPYPNYGILAKKYQDYILNTNKIKEDDYNKLYNDCVIDIVNNVFKGKIKKNKIILNPDIIKTMTCNDLNKIKELENKLYDNISYQNLLKYYNVNDYPLPNIIMKTEDNITFTNKSYPKTNYEFFKYEDFYTFNWYVYYNYLKQKYPTIIDYYIIEQQMLSFNKLILELKQLFNRLRPYQSSNIENISITHHISYAGQTPAMPSGHSVQGFLMGALLYHYGSLYFKSLDTKTFEKEINLLIRITKDTGHRRIIAGVHYPSDMIGSYYVYLNIIKYLDIDVKLYNERLLKEIFNF